MVEKALADLSDEELLIAVSNTGHREHDEFADAPSVRAWWDDLVGRAATGAHRRIAVDTLPMLHELRDVLRSLALRNNGVEIEADTPNLGRLDLRLDLRTVPSLHAIGTSDLARDISAAAVTALLRAMARPGWPRFKACRGEDCRWVFVDASRNSSRRWCDMAGCGNRAKSVSFRRRQHADRPAV